MFWFVDHLNHDHGLDLTFYSDEAWFHLSEYINFQKSRIWSTKNPHEFRETPLHPIKIGVWIAMSRRRIIGPISFEEKINAHNYREILLGPFIEQLHANELQNVYFQQDGATAHTAHGKIDFLQEYFDNRRKCRNICLLDHQI